MSISPRIRNRRRLWVCLAAPFVGLLLLEGGLRLMGLEAPVMPRVEENLLVPVKQTFLKFVNRPKGWKRVTFTEEGREWRVSMTLNEDRFRGPRVGRAKPNGILRIACLGDSHTFGDGVSNGETWPDHLRVFAGDSVEVINAGVNAFDTMQEALWYERFVEEFEPDVVLLAYFANDVAARGVAGGVEPDSLVIWTNPRQRGWIRTLREYSKAVDVISSRIYNSRSQQARQTSWNGRYVAGDPGWQLSRRALIRLRDRCRSTGAELRVALFPYMFPQGKRFASSEALGAVREFCEQNEIPCFDGEPALLRELATCESFQDLRVSQTDFHANGRAYRVFSQALGEWLSQQDVIPTVQ